MSNQSHKPNELGALPPQTFTALCPPAFMVVLYDVKMSRGRLLSVTCCLGKDSCLGREHNQLGCAACLPTINICHVCVPSCCWLSLSNVLSACCPLVFWKQRVPFDGCDTCFFLSAVMSLAQSRLLFERSHFSAEGPARSMHSCMAARYLVVCCSRAGLDESVCHEVNLPCFPAQAITGLIMETRNCAGMAAVMTQLPDATFNEIHVSAALSRLVKWPDAFSLKDKLTPETAQLVRRLLLLLQSSQPRLAPRLTFLKSRKLSNTITSV